MFGPMCLFLHVSSEVIGKERMFGPMCLFLRVSSEVIEKEHMFGPMCLFLCVSRNQSTTAVHVSLFYSRSMVPMCKRPKEQDMQEETEEEKRRTETPKQPEKAKWP